MKKQLLKTQASSIICLRFGNLLDLLKRLTYPKSQGSFSFSSLYLLSNCLLRIAPSSDASTYFQIETPSLFIYLFL